MRFPSIDIPRMLIILFIGSMGSIDAAQSQGKVIINEYMWNASTSCPQFVELINMGPGPQDISCYIIANESRSITIPTNTVLQPGQIYLIAGVSSYDKACLPAGTATNSTVNLNWTNCNNCGSTTMTTNGFMSTGNASTSYPLVLFDPNKKVLDAVRNDATPVTTSTITTAASGGCSTTTINLGTTSVTYESYTPSTGNENSYSRLQNGSCSWAKTTAISPGLNNTLSTDILISYTTNYQSLCNGGLATFTFTSSGVSTLFPLSYILVHDPRPQEEAGDGIGDIVTTANNVPATGSSSNVLSLSGLAGGDYRILIDPFSGCNQVVADFYIPFGTYTNTTFLTESTCDASGKGQTTITILDARSTEVFPMTYTLTTSSGTYTSATASQTTNGGWPALVLSNLNTGTYTMTFQPKEACAVSTTSFYVPLGTYSYTLTPSNICSGSSGSASVQFNTGIATEIFPLTYTYTTQQGATVTGTISSESTAGGLPDFVLSGLPTGTYNLTFKPSKACSSYTSSFTIYSGTYPYTIVTTPSCTANSGKVSFRFSTGTSAEIFPMNYTLLTPSGTVTGTAIDNPINDLPAFEITGLSTGTYSITFTPLQACSSSTSSFTISDGIYDPSEAIKQYQSGCNLANVSFYFEGVVTDEIAPLTYTITANSGGTYSNTTYSEATYINNFPSFTIENLPIGNYSIEFNLNNACQSNSSSFTLAVEECTTLSLALKKVTGKNIGNQNEFNIELDAREMLKALVLESSPDGKTFSKEGEIPFENKMGIQYLRYRTPVSENSFFRFSLLDIFSRLTYSGVLRVVSSSGNIGVKVNPNPFGNFLMLSTFSSKEDQLAVKIFSANGAMIQEQTLRLKKGQNNLSLITNHIPKGYYFISLKKNSSTEVQTTSLIKQ